MSGAYSPPAVAADGIEISFQPAVFTHTGPGMLGQKTMRDGFFLDALAYGLDAPTHLPRGSVNGELYRLGDWSPSCTGAFHYLGTNVPREAA